ncbi:MAG: DUF2007 domain-containing protein [Patescibacteria group bacterium]|nr:DUF2007 domain-containing protein [Patescibacteria group bacterium]
MEPPDSDSPDRTEPDDSKGATDRSGPVSDEWKTGRIVELCSTANAFEAHALQSMLEEAGIRSCVVGELLGSGACGLSLGEIVAPRVWVRANDAIRAREAADAWYRQTRQGSYVPDEGQDTAKWDVRSEDEDPSPTVVARSPWPGRSLTIAGLACIMAGAVWAGHRWKTVYTYSATTEGVLASYEPQLSMDRLPPPEVPRSRAHVTYTTWLDVSYTFEVNGRTYCTTVESSGPLKHRVPIHYDPTNPKNNHVGSLPSPWRVVAWAMGIGVGLLLARFVLLSSRRGAQTAGQEG